jgi:capsular exopolysaccharide synthesis family protein
MKDTPDRSDDLLPARRTFVPPAAAAEPADDYADPSYAQAPPPRGLSLRVVWRAFRRHWWQAVFLWLAGSGGLMFLAYSKIQPTYDAFSQIRVDNSTMAIYKESQTPVDLSLLMESEASRITSPTVILAALTSHNELTALPLLRGSPDTEADIRKALRVAVVPKTNRIQVEVSSTVPAEAADIVNAVVEAYLKIAHEAYDESTTQQIKVLEDKLKEQVDLIVGQRKAVEGLQNQVRQADVAADRKNATTIETFHKISGQLTDVQIMRIQVKAELDQLRNEKVLPQRTMDEEAVRAEVTDLFYSNPQVAALQAQREKAESKLKDVGRVARSSGDPAVIRLHEQVKSLNAKIDDLWTKLQPRLRRQVALNPVDADVEREIQRAEARLSALKVQEDTLTEKLEDVRGQSKEIEGEALKLEYARKDLDRAELVRDKIESALSQLKFNIRSPIARVNLEFKAKASNRPDGNRRLQAMAAAPVVTGMLILGLLVMLELRGARVSDPDELASRVNLQVIGVVPPLPQIRSAGPAPGAGPPATAGDLRAQRQLDEFVQSLDHLRVALCSRRDPWGRDRHCVLITSACGSEGKTTLAAQLAERCVNAGLMTLLIDADLRNPTLSRMLDAPENPGLINVLRGEMTAEDVVMVIGDAGGFHLLPAGTPRMDPSRLLASDRLSKLLAQARESFDMIIVDAPPVLPVPDALTIGRWTDGAVLAVRYDTSRFPLVERAYRRLAHVGVNVIGAVVNGVRTVESTYGGYYAYGGYGSYGSYAGDDANGSGHANGNGASPASTPSPASADD